MTTIKSKINSYEFFLDLAQKLQTTKNYSELYNLVLNSILEGTRYKGAWLFIIDQETESEAFMVSGTGGNEELASSAFMRLDMTSDPMLKEILEGHKPVIVEDGRTDPRTNKEIVKQMGIISIINFPIMITGELIGCLGMGTFEGHGVISPSEEELEFVTMLSLHIAPVIVRILEKEARDIYEQNLKAASDVKNQFLSSMSHEFRTPLNAILGFAQILQIHDDSAENRKNNVNEILHAGNHLLNLVDELLDLDKVQQGQLWVDTEVININVLISSCLQELENQFKDKNLNIKNNLSKTDTYYLYANTARMQRVINTLLQNAEKYNKNEGEITVSANVHDDSHIKITIEDSGVGISKEIQSKIFTPFANIQQEHFTSTEGISLSLSKQVVKLMGGDIGFESEPGKGTVFWVILRGFKQ